MDGGDKTLVPVWEAPSEDLPDLEDIPPITPRVFDLSLYLEELNEPTRYIELSNYSILMEDIIKNEKWYYYWITKF